MQVAPNDPRSSSSVAPDFDDRLWAGGAHLGYLLGLWLIAPIGVYLLHRRRSRFVAHHAVRAALLQLCAVALALAWYAVGLVSVVVIAALPGLVGVTVMLTLWLKLLALALAFLVVVVKAVGDACRGRGSPDALFAATAERLLAHDPAVTPR